MTTPRIIKQVRVPELHRVEMLVEHNGIEVVVTLNELLQPGDSARYSAHLPEIGVYEKTLDLAVDRAFWNAVGQTIPPKWFSSQEREVLFPDLFVALHQ